MGYRGKVKEHEAARRLRAQNLTIIQIADQLGVSKSSVSLWVRDVPFTPSKRRYGPRRRPHAAHLRKLEQIEQANAAARTCLGMMTQQAFFTAGIALYAGEGSKSELTFANTDHRMIRFFCVWLTLVESHRDPSFTISNWLSGSC